MINLKNSWKSHVKQKDKVKIEIRISSLTLLEISVDLSQKKLSVVFFNFGLQIG